MEGLQETSPQRQVSPGSESRASPVVQGMTPSGGGTCTLQGHPRRICFVLSLLPAAVSPDAFTAFPMVSGTLLNCLQPTPLC